MSYSKLFCTGTATSDVFSNKDLFPLFYRTLPADSFQGTFIARYCTYMGWTTINIVTGTDSYSSSIYAAFWAKAFALGITSAQIQVADSVTFLAADYRRLVNQLSSSTSRVILCLSGPTIIQQVMRAATTAGFGKSWVWVGGDGMGSYLSQVPHLSAQEQAFAEGTLAVFAAESAPGTYRYEQLLAEYSSIYGASHASDVSHSAFALFTGACLETMVYGWVQIARQYGVANILNGSYRPRLADFTTPLITVTGATSFLPTGDRDGLYVVLNLQNGTTVPVYQGDPSGVIVQKATPMFPDGTSTPPDWRPSYSLIYPDPTTPGVIAILALSGIMAICIIVSWAWMVLYRKTRRMRHLGLSFLTTLCVGLLALLSIPVWRAAVPTPTRCAGEVSALFLGFSLSLSSIYIRSFRIFKIFDKYAAFSCFCEVYSFFCNSRIVSKVWSTSTRALVARMLAIPLIQAALLAIQQTTSPIALVELRTITTLSYMCDLGSFATLSGLAWNLSVLLNLLLLLLLGWTSFRIRHIQASYQDTQWLVYAIQHIFVRAILYFHSIDFTHSS
ncbi:periplasmic binding protein-like I [Blastocladiella britannica]|nr:periplasmic binding protein-like I [Blastocladiella britannica]